jgi:hypothetical protein
LPQALSAAEPGDVILIRHDGELSVEPTLLDKEVTIRPARDCNPILVLSTREKNASMFRLHDTKVRFQNLAFRLAPAQKGFESQAIVTVVGDGMCAFEKCVLTLAEAMGCTLSAVVLADPSTVMMPKEPRPGVGPLGPSLTFESCFIRGSGDLVWCRASRPFLLTAEDTLAALGGSILLIDAGNYDASAEASAKSDIRFTRVTAAVGGSLLRLVPAKENLKGIVPVHWTPKQCLFVSQGGGDSAPALIDILGGQASEEALKQKLVWSPGTNAYGFPEFLDQPSSDIKLMRPTPFKWDTWKTFTGEMNSRTLDMVKFNDIPDNLARARPGQFVLPDLKDFGANTEKLPLPKKD